MEALQVLKFAIKKDHIDFTSHLQFPEHTFTADVPSSANTLMEMTKMKPDALKAFLDTVNFDD
jgi:hypothetical protein